MERIDLEDFESLDMIVLFERIQWMDENRCSSMSIVKKNFRNEVGLILKLKYGTKKQGTGIIVNIKVPTVKKYVTLEWKNAIQWRKHNIILQLCIQLWIL